MQKNKTLLFEKVKEEVQLSISQGDIYWLDLGEPEGSEPGFRRPVIVIQNDVFNTSRIQTTVVCICTNNLKRLKSPGNVLLKKGTSGIKKDCVINITQILTVNKNDLEEKIGLLSEKKLKDVIAGINLLTKVISLPKEY